MKSSASGPLTLVGAAMLVVGVTVVHGMWTERWKARGVSQELEQAAALLERAFPESFGEWRLERELEGDPKELERAGAVGHISRLYRNSRSKARVSAFVVCARPHDASGHTPDRCYPGAGFEVGEAEHRQTIPLSDGRSAEAFTGTFRKSGQMLRIFWTYGMRDKASIAKEDISGSRTWVAPHLARIALDSEPAVYKLYAIVDETRLTAAQSMVECENFLSNLLPAFDAALAVKTAVTDPAAEGTGPAAEDSASSPPKAVEAAE